MVQIRFQQGRKSPSYGLRTQNILRFGQQATQRREVRSRQLQFVRAGGGRGAGVFHGTGVKVGRGAGGGIGVRVGVGVAVGVGGGGSGGGGGGGGGGEGGGGGGGSGGLKSSRMPGGLGRARFVRSCSPQSVVSSSSPRYTITSSCKSMVSPRAAHTGGIVRRISRVSWSTLIGGRAAGFSRWRFTPTS